MTLPITLQKIKNFLKKLPGVGERTSERFAFDLLRWKEDEIQKFSELLAQFRSSMRNCSECGALIEANCPYCCSPSRNRGMLCVVSTPREIFSLESIRCYDGLYHVLGGPISPLDSPEQNEEKVKRLKERILSCGIKEIFLALDSTLEGDATAHFLKSELATLEIKFTRPAFGIPVGSPLEGIDVGTLAKAFLSRSNF